MVNLLQEISSPLFREKDVSVAILRLDMIDPFISGNKMFKLHYFLEACLQSEQKKMLTFGGAWSNHLLATAFACRKAGLHCIGIIRGEEPAEMSATLLKCRNAGMQLQFVSRSRYRKFSNMLVAELSVYFPNCTIVPEGGFAPEGAAGAALIPEMLASEPDAFICTAVGTGCTLGGLLKGRTNSQKIIGVPVLKNLSDIPERLGALQISFLQQELIIFDGYHFGGYAKQNSRLIDFMNNFFNAHEVPSDFIYTGKMFFAITDQIEKDFFKPCSRIILVHTGGLPGNASLTAGTLAF